MEVMTATELLIKAEKLAKFIGYENVECKSSSGPEKKWIAKVTTNKHSSEIIRVERSPELVLKLVIDHLAGIAGDKARRLNKELEDV